MDPRYPIGKFEMPAQVTPALRKAAIEDMAGAPARMREAVRGLGDSQMDTPYREGGWTVRQVVHHVADSHMNALIRLKLALTEDNPTIKPYNETEWAKLPDAAMPVEPSQVLLDSVHARMDPILRAMKPEQFSRKMVHPEHGERTVDWLLFLYQWHGKHHAAHITELRKQKGW